MRGQRHRGVVAGALGVCASLACGGRTEDPDPAQVSSAELSFAASAWPLGSADVAASGNNQREQVLGRESVARLEVKWAFDTARAGHVVSPIHATPVVDGRGSVYVGDAGGVFYAIDRDGNLLWEALTEPPAPLLALILNPGGPPPPSTPLFGAAALAPERRIVVYADAGARVYARDRRTGAELWTRAVDPHPLGGVQSNSLSIVEDTVLVGVASAEDAWPGLHEAGVPVECCSHSGLLVALDLDTGEERWRYETIPEVQRLPERFAPYTLGPAGADIWSQPSYDEQTDTVYVSTGQNFTPGPDGHSSPTSDAIVALDFRSGEPRWVHQFTQDDIWVSGDPSPDPVTGRFLDADVGDAPKLYRLRDGRRVVGAGQKDGRYHVLDAATGASIRSTQQLNPPNALGGFQGGSAVGEGLVYQHGTQLDAGSFSCFTPDCLEGRVLALGDDGRRVRWSIALRASLLLGGVALANRVLYFQSPVAEAVPLVEPPQWAFYAVDARTGEELARLTFDGRSITAPAIAGGHVYIGTGNAVISQFGFDFAGSLVQLGLREERGGKRR